MVNNGDKGRVLEDIRVRFFSVIKLCMLANLCLSKKCYLPHILEKIILFFFILSVSQHGLSIEFVSLGRKALQNNNTQKTQLWVW